MPQEATEYAPVTSGVHTDQGTAAPAPTCYHHGTVLRSPSSPLPPHAANAVPPPWTTHLPTKRLPIAVVEPYEHDEARVPLQEPKAGFSRTQSSRHGGLLDIVDGGKQSIPLYRRLLYDTWLPEVVALAISMACLAALAILLACFDDRPTDKFGSLLSLNTVVAILSAGMRIPLAFAMTSALGQTKWCRISRRPGHLVSLQDIDLASRGPLGSLLYLCSTMVLSLGSLGAIVLVLALAVDVVFQQSIGSQIKLVALDSDRATIRTRGSYHGVGQPNPEIRGLLETSIWNGALQLEPSCPTSDCYWDSYEYTGWCSSCETNKQPSRWSGCQISLPSDNLTTIALGDSDIAPEFPCNISYAGASGDLTWQAFVRLDPSYTDDDLEPLVGLTVPLRVSLDPSSLVSDLDWTGRYFLLDVEDGQFRSIYQDGHIADIQNPGFVKTALTLDWSYDSATGVLQSSINETLDCGIARCRKEFEVTISNHTLQSRLKHKTFLTGYQPKLPDDVDDSTVYCYRNLALSPPIWPSNMTAFLQRSDEGLYFDPSTFTTCLPDGAPKIGKEDQYIYDLFLGNSTTIAALITNNGSEVSTSPDVNREVIYDPLLQRNQIGTRLPEAMHNLTTALDTFQLRGSNETVVGVVYANKGIVIVRWQWFILPLLLEGIGITFFVLVVIRTRRQRVRIWKTSILPFIYHALPRQDLRLDGLDRASDMLRDAQRVKVSLVADEQAVNGRKMQVVTG